MIFLFSVFFFLFLYIYIWYPICIWFLSRFFPNKDIDSSIDYIPLVTILIPVKNEELTIEEKIQNIQSLTYPKDKLQILIVDSSSTDNTAAIVDKYSSDGIEIQTVPHKGKAYAMKQWIDLYAQWEIIISTDANAYFKEDVIEKIVKNFHDPSVWGVSGAMMQLDKSGTNESVGSWLYWKVEKFLRIHESRFHSCICMNGEITCIRKSIVKNKKWYYKGDPDDFDLSLFIVKSGYRIIYESEAFVWEIAPDNASDIEKQKVRIIVQTISAFTHYFSVLFQKRYGFILFSHKFLSLCSPLFLIGIYVSNIFLLDISFFVFIFLIQNIFYICYVFRINYSFLTAVNFVLFLNYLILKSYFVFLSWKDFTKWDKIMSSRK